MRIRLPLLAAPVLAGLALSLAPAVEAADLVVYTARNEQLIKPLFDRYTAETGVEIEFLTDKEAPLMARLQAEGARTEADVFMTVDAGNLWQAAQLGLLRKLESPVLESNIPGHLQDPENRWFGLSVRARTLIYNTDKVQPSELSTYEALANAEWKGRLCLRTSKKVYNQSLVATLIENHGAEGAEAIVAGWVANLAAQPFASDDEVIQAVAAGRCDVGIANTYYFGRLKRDNPALPAAIFWPNQGEGQRGVHVNVSGAGVTTHAKRPEAAQAFLEWLSAGEAQAQFASVNFEFPANPAVAVDPAVADWGPFRQDLINVSRAGALQVQATQLMDRVGYR
ncbi:extracellular solute-binding protein [Aquimonas voraii]|uniref:Iron(III) transport system substrate-binding protein n=1 Tax=Aquimonas voraii TaxID=265719 RepID=A0A1G6SKF1_9GAMM|nr:extracellular solute-binding protein [Aquimonas voraii]SDD16647.1 iron(III) transport system substrate-binding protein [Aquimonas voraii]